ncbi:MAG: hypothetical protein IPL84_05430 [Chitinophagaceae bacterium]|nr:hypothetical protein [Chitinophagaceae bacterium]
MVTIIWLTVPVLLFLISKGLTFWISIITISLVIGAYNSIIRGKISEISNSITNPVDKGSLFGFLEVAGRFSQVIGPLLIALVTLYFPLNYGILFVTIFPVGALILLRKYKW